MYGGVVDVPLWQIPGWIVAFLAGGGVLKHYFYDRPKVRLRAAADPRSVARYEPVIQFKVTNERKEEVHISAITVVRKTKNGESHDLLGTKPSKGTKFRLPGLEEESFESTWEELFPDDHENPSGLDEVTELYVKNIATEKRYRLPAGDLEAIREAIEPTLKHRREKARWTLTCRSCKKKTSWLARRPRPTGSGGYTYNFGFPEHEGWTDHEFSPYAVDGDALCPKCTSESGGAQMTEKTEAG